MYRGRVFMQCSPCLSRKTHALVAGADHKFSFTLPRRVTKRYRPAADRRASELLLLRYTVLRELALRSFGAAECARNLLRHCLPGAR